MDNFFFCPNVFKSHLPHRHWNLSICGNWLRMSVAKLFSKLKCFKKHCGKRSYCALSNAGPDKKICQWLIISYMHLRIICNGHVLKNASYIDLPLIEDLMVRLHEFADKQLCHLLKGFWLNAVLCRFQQYFSYITAFPGYFISTTKINLFILTPNLSNKSRRQGSSTIFNPFPHTTTLQQILISLL